MKRLLSGNEAIAYGAYENGVRLGSAYPGTPSTEIMENFATYPGVYAEWAPNEKVALDVGIGAAYAGARALVTMKHVGVNVAADSLFYAVYTGLRAGLVVVTADDPGMHSSQNEQDNRQYAKFAKLPILEPSDSEEARRMVGVALSLSEEFDTPVLLRTTTRIAHSKSVTDIPEGELKPVGEPWQKKPFQKDIGQFVMVPANARRRHPVVEERIRRLAGYAETSPLNRMELGDPEIGIITSGVAYQYAREVFPRASFLKLGMAYPLPERLIRSFAAQVKQVVVIEELDPFYEEYLRTLGIPVRGKDVFPICGEFSPELVRECASKAGLLPPAPPLPAVPAAALPPRPPMLCPGCGHRGIFYVLQRMRVAVFGDIGCYTLGSAPPLSALHTCGCMGASIGVAHGVDKVGVSDRTVAVLGDSTFFHSGIAPLVNVVYNQGVSTTIILDNRVTAMTGHQDNPGTGRTLQGQATPVIDLERLVRGLGVEKVDTVNPYELDTVRRVLKDHLDDPRPSVVIARYPCVLNTKEKHPVPRVDLEVCNDCGTCLKIGCPPLTKVEGGVQVDELLCNGCGYCATVCPHKAIATA